MLRAAGHVGGVAASDQSIKNQVFSLYFFMAGWSPAVTRVEFFLLLVPEVGIPVFLGVVLGLVPPMMPDPPLEVAGAEIEKI